MAVINQSILKVKHDLVTSAIDDNKIIVAIQPNDILVSVSNTRRERYIELQIERKGISKYISIIKRFFGHSIYYKAKQEQKKNNIAFLQSLLQTKKVELILYTKLEQQVIDNLLKKLDLTKYFNQENRKFYHSPSEKKHPTEIDSNIKRVIILSGTRNDHSDEDSQYFLVLKKTQLKEYGRALTALIANNRGIDELHNQFVHWKIQIQSDYDSSHQKTE